MRANLTLTNEDRAMLNRWIFGALTSERQHDNGVSYHARNPVTCEQISESYQRWSRGGFAWDRAGQGGTGVMSMLVWYHHVHKPGSREWRPAVIIRAALAAAREWSAATEGER